MCHMSSATCHLSPTPTATDPPPANFPIMHNRLVHKDQKPKIKSKPKKSLKWRRKNCVMLGQY